MISATSATASATASAATSTTYGAAASVRAMLMRRYLTAGTETRQVATTAVMIVLTAANGKLSFSPMSAATPRP